MAQFERKNVDLYKITSAKLVNGCANVVEIGPTVNHNYFRYQNFLIIFDSPALSHEQ